MYYEVLYYLCSALGQPRAVRISQLESPADKQEPMLTIAIPQIIDNNLIQQGYSNFTTAGMVILQMHPLQQDTPHIPLDLSLGTLAELMGPIIEQIDAMYEQIYRFADSHVVALHGRYLAP